MALAKITVLSTAKFTKHIETASETRVSEAHGMDIAFHTCKTGGPKWPLRK